MERRVEPEWLDELSANDPRAQCSRNDLRRLNALMGNAGMIANELRGAFSESALQRITEIGAGDGDFLLQVVRRLRLRNDVSPREILLVDRQFLLSEKAKHEFRDLHWNAAALESDALVYLANGAPKSNAIIANLFLHHFSDARLCELLKCAAGKTDAFIALEPRRSAFAFFFSKQVGFIGCGPVTRNDAPVSVRAGFANREISARWPDHENWNLTERPAGLFGHLFVARRKS
jgi:hypothetical protein